VNAKVAFALVVLVATIATVRGGAANRADGTAPFELPPPTGRFPVGTTTWRVIDPSRRETLADAAAPREVEVMAWYPAASAGGELAPYLREGLGEVQAFAALVRGERTAWDGLAAVRTHAHMDAAPTAAGRRLPLLVFSHGYGGLATAYTALLEDLASRGYAVLSIVHPYEVAAATLSNGRVVSFINPEGSPRQAYLDVVAEWDTEDATMAAVTAAGDEAAQRDLLKGYFSGLNNTHAALRRWVDDTKLVLDRLSASPRGAVAAQLAARIDSGRIGVFGHSMGGVTAAQFCVDDRRCRAGLNLDGIPQSGTMIDRPMNRPFLMVYSGRPGRLGASDAIYRRAASPYYRVDVAGTRHLDFSDMIFWGGPLRERGAFGTIAPERAAGITRAIVGQYFDQVLLGRPSAVLAGRSGFTEVTVPAAGPARTPEQARKRQLDAVP
jgi:predicted dienelactone hydrolase